MPPFKPLSTPLHLADHCSRRYAINLDQVSAELGEEITAKHLFTPAFWSKSMKILRAGDTLRVWRGDGSDGEAFDIDLVVKGVAPGGVIMAIHGADTLPGTAKRAELDAIAAKVQAEDQAARIAAVTL